MTQPKAKWSLYEDGQRVWTAAVGPFYLEVDGANGRCEISQWDGDYGQIGDEIWVHTVDPVVDIPDLMRLTEAELARRLEHAAGTMEGSGLVAAAGRPGCRVREYGVVVDDIVQTTTPEQRAALTDWVRTHIAGSFQSSPSSAVPREDLLSAVAPNAVAKLTAGRRDGSGLASAEPRFNVGDRVTAKHHTRLRDVMLDAIGFVESTQGDIGVVTFNNWRSKVTCNLSDLEFYEATKAAPRFKVGDLVRDQRGVVGAVKESLTELGSTWHKVFFADGVVGPLFDENAVAYTLPTITSYAELADVLDELPEGWRVEVRRNGVSPAQDYRCVRGEYQAFTHGAEKPSWARHDIRAIYRGASPGDSFRLLPPGGC